MTNIVLKYLSVIFVYVLAVAFFAWSLQSFLNDPTYRFWIPQFLGGAIACGWVEYLRSKTKPKEWTQVRPPLNNNVLIRSGKAPGVGWSRDMLCSGFNILHRSVVRRQTGFAARITRTLSRLNEFERFCPRSNTQNGQSQNIFVSLPDCWHGRTSEGYAFQREIRTRVYWLYCDQTTDTVWRCRVLQRVFYWCR